MGVHVQRTGDGDTLLLTRRKLRRELVGMRIALQRAQQLQALSRAAALYRVSALSPAPASGFRYRQR